MPLALIALGLIAIVTAINGSFTTMVSQLEQDISGQFLYWVAAVLLVGSIGFIPGWKGPSRLFLLLVVVVIILANGGLWQKLTSALQQGATSTAGAQPLSTINTAPVVGAASAASTADLSGLVYPSVTSANVAGAASSTEQAAQAGNISAQAATIDILSNEAQTATLLGDAGLAMYPGSTGGAYFTAQASPRGVTTFLNAAGQRIPLLGGNPVPDATSGY